MEFIVLIINGRLMENLKNGFQISKKIRKYNTEKSRKGFLFVLMEI